MYFNKEFDMNVNEEKLNIPDNQTEVKDNKAEIKEKEEQLKELKKQKKKEESADKLIKKVGKSERSVKSYQRFIIRLLILIVVIWILLFQIVGITHMPSGDMYPRIDSGDLVLFYRLDKDPKAQDIMVIQKEVEIDGVKSKQLFICRVVAVAGDTVQITDGERLVVNGNTMIESNIFYNTPRYEGFVDYPLTLGEGECFVLSDSRNGGTDSRFFGPVLKEEILGTVIMILRRNNL